MPDCFGVINVRNDGFPLNNYLNLLPIGAAPLSCRARGSTHRWAGHAVRTVLLLMGRRRTVAVWTTQRRSLLSVVMLCCLLLLLLCDRRTGTVESCSGEIKINKLMECSTVDETHIVPPSRSYCELLRCHACRRHVHAGWWSRHDAEPIAIGCCC